MSLLLPLLASIATPSASAGPLEAATKAWESCVDRKALWYSKSTEGAEVASEAALQACDAERQTMYAASRSPNVQLQKTVEDFIDGVVKDTRKRALLAVVDARMAKTR